MTYTHPLKSIRQQIHQFKTFFPTYTFKKQKYTEYVYRYYTMKNEKELFEKYFIKNNPIIRKNNNQIKIQ